MNDTFWQDRSTLVTGATGLVGGWLVPRLLAAGADVVCLVRDLGERQEITYPTQRRMVFQDRLDRPGKADLRVSHFLPLALPLQSRTGTALESPATWLTPDVL